MSSVSETNSHNTHKRRRVSLELVQDPDLWIEDGNVVIAVADETSEEKIMRGFKCHRGVLAKHSQVFAGLFSIPPSGEAEDMYDGLPLVTLPDAYADVKSLLRFLYDPDYEALRPGDRNPWDSNKRRAAMLAMAGVVSLASKYEVSRLQKSLKQSIELYWPTTMEKWDDYERYIWNNKGGPSDPHSSADIAIKVGVEVQIPNILPSAFYIINIHLFSLAQLQSKVTKLSSIRAVRGSASGACTPNTHTLLDSLLSRLQPSQMSQLIHGRELLRTVTTLLVNSVLQSAVAHCKGCYGGEPTKDHPTTSCAAKARQWYNKVRETLFTTSTFNCQWFNDPLRGLTLLKLQAERVSASFDGVCAGCSAQIVKIIAALRRYIWDELPYIFLLKAREPERVYGYASYIEPFVSVVT